MTLEITAVPSVLIEESENSRTCRHEDVETLGDDDSAAFLRCATCGSIVIVHGAHRWIIRPTDESGPLPF
jgi:hypothetical protein